MNTDAKKGDKITFEEIKTNGMITDSFYLGFPFVMGEPQLIIRYECYQMAFYLNEDKKTIWKAEPLKLKAEEND